MTIQVLCFHRVIRDDVEQSHWPWLLRGTAMTARHFAARMQELEAAHEWVNENDVLEYISSGRATTRTGVWVTFDDGYRDNLEVAGPLVKKLGIEPTLFLTTRVLRSGFLLPVDRWYRTLVSATRRRATVDLGDGPVRVNLDDPQCRHRLVSGREKRRFVRAHVTVQDWMVRRLASALDCEPDPSCEVGGQFEYLRVADLAQLTRLGWRIGPHGASHQLLPSMEPCDMESDVLESVRELQHHGLSTSQWFAWPDGAWTPASRIALRALLEPMGYRGALTIDAGLVTARSDAWALPRHLAKANGTMSLS